MLGTPLARRAQKWLSRRQHPCASMHNSPIMRVVPNVSERIGSALKAIWCQNMEGHSVQAWKWLLSTLAWSGSTFNKLWPQKRANQHTTRTHGWRTVSRFCGNKAFSPCSMHIERCVSRNCGDRLLWSTNCRSRSCDRNHKQAT